MTQQSVTVVIPVWNQWQFTKGCLESLRPTLGIRDEVIVVDNGSEDETAKGLKQYPWVTVITNEVNQGFAIACNQGATAASGDVVVFLNNDTLVPNRWLDGLIAPFVDASVFATGPRSNMVSGPQIVENPDYEFGSMSSLKKFAKTWREEHRAQTTETPRLVGFCLAVRKSAFDLVGGFDETFETGGAEDDDLCLRLVQSGGRLLICHESFVHHHGHATFQGNGLDWFAIQQVNMDRFRTKHSGANSLTPRAIDGPLLSACMITKDEEAILQECIASLNGLVDEVVVYDTGSTDRTIEIAKAAGAKVIEGYWDDDFGRARNASLDECSGEWVLHIDADEVFEGDATKLRALLASSQASAYQIEILNLSGNGKNDLTHRPCRVFQRKLYHWEGRLHEQVTFRTGVYRTDFGVLPGVRIVHSGYTPEMMASKNKAERNIRIAQADADTSSGRDTMDKLSNLGRSYTLAGRNEEALNIYTQARALETDSPVIRRTLYRAGAQAALAVGRPEETLQWIDELKAVSEKQDTARYIRGSALTDLSRWEDALIELEGLEDMKDDDGVVFPMFLLRLNRARCYAALAKYEKAATELELVAGEEACDEPIWALVAEVYHRTGRDMRALLTTIPPSKMNAIFGQIISASPEAADDMLDALYEDAERRPSVLALAIRIAPRLATPRCLEWSARLRGVGLSEHCPLIAKANLPATPPLKALEAAAIAHATFADERSLPAVEHIASTLPVMEFHEAIVAINELHPALLGALILACASTASRCMAMAHVLHEMGADDQAVAVVLHGRSLPAGDSIATDAANWLESLGRVEDAAAMRSGLA